MAKKELIRANKRWISAKQANSKIHFEEKEVEIRRSMAI
jgi:hypothetical protein